MTKESLVLILILMGGKMSSCQEVEQSRLEDVYRIVDMVLHKNIDSQKVHLLEAPLRLERINDSLLRPLVRQNKLNENEIAYLLQQADSSSVTRWDQTKLGEIKLISTRRRHFPKNTYGLSPPLFSPNNDLAIIYVRYLGPDMIHEEILVYELRRGAWVFLTSLLSIVS